jgi:hypothetical protein
VAEPGAPVSNPTVVPSFDRNSQRNASARSSAKACGDLTKAAVQNLSRGLGPRNSLRSLTMNFESIMPYLVREFAFGFVFAFFAGFFLLDFFGLGMTVPQFVRVVSLYGPARLESLVCAVPGA